MTPYIKAKKAEVREKLLARIASSREFNWEGGFQPEFLAVFVEEELDTLLDEIESRVMELRHVGAITTIDDYANGWNDCRKEAFQRTKEAFQHLRTGVETEV